MNLIRSAVNFYLCKRIFAIGLCGGGGRNRYNPDEQVSIGGDSISARPGLNDAGLGGFMGWALELGREGSDLGCN